MNKNDLIEHIAEETEMTKSQAKQALEAALSGIVNGMKKDGEVRLVGFGNFVVSRRAATTARNPKTGEPVAVPATNQARYKPSETVKKAVNA